MFPYMFCFFKHYVLCLPACAFERFNKENVLSNKVQTCANLGPVDYYRLNEQSKLWFSVNTERK